MKVEQDDGLAIAVGQCEHGASYHFVVLLFGQSVVLSSGGGGLVDFVHRYVDSGEALKLGAKDVGRESEEPGGEAGLVAPVGETAPGAQKGFRSEEHTSELQS